MHGLPGFVGGTGDGVAALEVLQEPRHIAIFTRASIDEQYFHFVSFFVVFAAKCTKIAKRVIGSREVELSNIGNLQPMRSEQKA